MWALFLPLLTSIFGPEGLITQYAKTKADIRQKEQDYKLAVLDGNIKQVTQQIISDSSDVKNRLEATSQGFKQSQWYFFGALIVFSVLLPSKAEIMWHNLNIVPDWIQNTFVAMTLVTWGINPVKNGINWFKDTTSTALENRSNRQIAKIKAFNDAKFFESIRKSMGNGIDQRTVDMLNKGITDAEQE